MATMTSSTLIANMSQLETGSRVQSHPFTCVTCTIAFRSSELQRGHMRSDWHRYNLKRRVASLPPLSSEIFAEKVLNAQANQTAEAAKATFEKSCMACQKTYYSQNAYQNHVGSQKHRTRLAQLDSGGMESVDDGTTSMVSSTLSLGKPLDASSELEPHNPAESDFSEVVRKIQDASLDENEQLPSRPFQPQPSSQSRTSTANETDSPPTTVKSSTQISPSQCLFCNYISPTFKLNVMHMTKFHGMFIPEQPYLVDLEGLIAYLQAKIHENFECLFCHKLKSSAAAVQTHMRDKGHCMIAFDTEEEMIEVGQFYDFRSTYSDDEEEDEESEAERSAEKNAGVRLGARRSLDLEGDSKMGEEDGWETDSSASSLDSEELTAVPIDHDHAYERLAHHRHHTHSDPRPHRALDGFHSHAHSRHAAFYSDHELHLPSGRTAGHRSLARYFRQNLHNHPTAEERVQQRMLENSEANEDVEGVADHHRQSNGNRQVATRANGGLGMVGVSDAKKKQVVAVEKREQKRVQRQQSKYKWGNEKQNNYQKHFRDEMLQ